MKNTMNTQAEVIRFEVGNIYELRFVGDHNVRPQYICTKRTALSVSFEEFNSPHAPKLTKRFKIHNGHEYITAGNYSMAPIIRADKVVG